MSHGYIYVPSCRYTSRVFWVKPYVVPSPSLPSAVYASQHKRVVHWVFFQSHICTPLPIFITIAVHFLPLRTLLLSLAPNSDAMSTSWYRTLTLFFFFKRHRQLTTLISSHPSNLLSSLPTYWPLSHPLSLPGLLFYQPYHLTWFPTFHKPFVHHSPTPVILQFPHPYSLHYSMRIKRPMYGISAHRLSLESSLQIRLSLIIPKSDSPFFRCPPLHLFSIFSITLN